MGDPADLAGHRCREEHHLTLLRQLAQDPLDVVDEAHAQHLVGFVEHQAAQPGDIEGALTHVVHHPAGGADHDLNPALELVDLIAEVRAAVEGQDPQVGKFGGVALEGVGHLDGELTGGGEHQHLGGALGLIEGRQHRQGEGRRFAGTGLGLTHQVAAEHQLRNGSRLDRGGLAVADLREGFEDSVGEAEGGKPVLLTGFCLGDFDAFARCAVLAAGQIERAEIHRAGCALAGGIGHVVGLGLNPSSTGRQTPVEETALPFTKGEEST